MKSNDALTLLLCSLLAWAGAIFVGSALVSGYRQAREFYVQGLNELVLKDTYARKFNRNE